MINSRTYLITSTALLSIFGVAVATISNFAVVTTRFYCTQLGVLTKQICVTLSGKVNVHFTLTTGSKTFYFTVNTSRYTVYTDGLTGSTGVQCASSNGCSVPLTYNTFQ